MSLPRTPEHFPRMKHRAAGRAIRKQRRHMMKAMEVLPKITTAIPALIEVFAQIGRIYINTVEIMVETVTDWFNDASRATRDDYALAE